MKTLLTLALGLWSLCTVLPAQQSLLQKVPKATTALHGSYNPRTGFEQNNTAYRSGPETLFNNREGITYYYIVSYHDEEYVDEGAFPQRGVNQTEQVNGLIWDYCSGLSDPVGDALTVEFRLYQDTVPFFGPTGWTASTFDHGSICAHSLVGLPGDTLLTGLTCWIITLDLANGFECTLPQELTPGGMEAFGWSAMYLDPTDTSGPLLDSRVGALHNGYGNIDLIEIFNLSRPAGSEYQGTWWGGGPKTLANFNFTLFGNVNDTEAYYSAAPLPNDLLEWQASAEVRGGAAASWSVTNPDGLSNYSMLVSSAAADSPLLAGGTASLLVHPGRLLTTPIPMGTTGSFGASLPVNLPASLYTQAVQHTGALAPPNTTAASNGLKHSN